MNDPRRLLQDSPSELEAELLRSIAAERPTFEHRVRVKQALGLGPIASLAPGASAGSFGASKMAIAGLIAAGAALLAPRAFRAATTARPATSIEVSAPWSLAEPVELPARIVIEPSAPGPPSPIPRATAITSSRTMRDSKNATTEAAATSDIREQIALIDEAHAAVGRRDSAAALRAVELYGARFPAGAFDQEARVIRIEALDQSGNHARAASLARAFLTKHPGSAHAKRLERIAGN